MVRIFWGSLLFHLLISLSVFGQLNLNLRSNLQYSQTLNDIWGYANGEDEYALVGTVEGVSIVNISNPDSVYEVQYIPDANSTWRDIKTWDHYAYAVNETGAGLLIVDLDSLPFSIDTFRWTGAGTPINFTDAHNLFIDENGFCYLVGGNTANGGAKILDLNSNPTNPTLVGVYNLRSVHDVFVRGDTMWSAEISSGIISVVDVSDKANPTVMTTFSTPNNFAHNCWLSEDGTTLITTDEVGGAFVTAYDVSDLNSISELDRYQSSPGQSVIPHNTFWLNGYAITSYYTDGVTIVDANRPNNLIETGFYDTSPLTGQSFNGCWGVYPFLPSGNILASDQQTGLFVLTPNYQRAAYLEGLVTDSNTTFPLNGVEVEILGTATTEFSSITGAFQTGLAHAGTYNIQFSKPGYFSKTINSVSLQQGVVTNLNVQLAPISNFILTGMVTDSAGNGLEGAAVEILNQTFSFSATTDTNGNFSIPTFFIGSYEFFAGKWGYQTTLQNITVTGPGTHPVAVLAEGYYDDFAVDLGWQASGNASSGFWVREDPIATAFQGNLVNPGTDLQNDLGNKCFVTGNGGGSAGTDDVDNGRVNLVSPTIDLSGYGDPYLSFNRWFYNGGGSGTPNDSLRISLRDGSNSAELDFVRFGTQTPGQWTFINIRVADFMTPGSNMNLVVTAADVGNGHLVEAGLDRFQIVDSMPPMPSCNQVVGLETSKITPTSARLAWSTENNAVSYTIRGRNANNTNWTVLMIPNGITAFKDVFGLSYNQSYVWQIQAVCNINGTEVGSWSVLDTFYTDCLPPDSLSTFPVSTNAASLNWANTPGAVAFEIRGRRTSTTNWANLLVSGNLNSKNVFGLLQGTEYEWMIRSWCDTNGFKKSSYTLPIIFRTTSGSKTRSDLVKPISDLFPNPTSGNLNIFIQGSGSLSIYSATGKKVFCNTQVEGNNTVNIEHLSSGIYTAIIQTKTESLTYKFVKL